MHVNLEQESTPAMTDFDRARRLMSDAILAGRVAALSGDAAELASCELIIRRAQWFALHAWHDVPLFAVHNRRRGEWLRPRRTELAQVTGRVSHGVGAMLSAASWLYAGGEFACERAAATGDVELFKVAATLTATARTHDFGAYELAVREAKVREDDGPDPWEVKP